MIYLGIDPGKSGGMACINPLTSDMNSIDARPVPLAGKFIDWALVGHWLCTWGPMRGSDRQVHLCIEKVHAMPGQGVSSMFSFGGSYHGMLALIEYLEIPHTLVTPQTWKRTILKGTKKDKHAAIEYCKRRWPGVDLLATPRSRKAHDGMADALCIAAYAEWLDKKETNAS